MKGYDMKFDEGWDEAECHAMTSNEIESHDMTSNEMIGR